jgi:SAM-dependent methyltransferase
MISFAHNLLKNIKARTNVHNYGRHIIADWVKQYGLKNPQSEYKILDIGCSRGFDLMNIKDKTGYMFDMHGIEIFKESIKSARKNGINVKEIDIEREPLSYPDNTFDIIIANQVLEHTKELFWICSEVRRILKPGGLFIIGVPNLAALHNRVLLLFGKQPSSIRVLGTHVRGFTIGGLKEFCEANKLFKLLGIKGSNFYPFPWVIAKPLCFLFPSLAVCIFLNLEKTSIQGSHTDLLENSGFQTNYVGENYT